MAAGRRAGISRKARKLTGGQLDPGIGLPLLGQFPFQGEGRPQVQRHAPAHGADMGDRKRRLYTDRKVGTRKRRVFSFVYLPFALIAGQ